MQIPRRICVIDDEAELLRATSSLLRSCGYCVATFVSAEDFLAAGPVGQWDCVIADVQMRGMSGLDLYAVLRFRQERVPFIVITAMAEGAIRGATHGGLCVLQKPYPAERLLACVEEAIRSSGSRP